MYNYTPYFYIIKDTLNDMYYAGAKWGKDANPSNFMTEEGYKSSSKTIHSLIKDNGIDIFIVCKLKIFETAEEAQNYETRFLRRINARQNKKFYNEHNNDGAMYSEYMRVYFMKKYGVEHNSKLDKMQSKRLETIRNKYGSFSNMMEVTGGNKKSLESFKKNSGLNNPFLLPTSIDKRKETSLQRYGVENPFLCSAIQEKARKAASLKIKNECDARHKDNIQKVMNSDINFSERGWCSKVAKLIGIKHQNVSRWMKRHMPEFYYSNCLIRKTPKR